MRTIVRAERGTIAQEWSGTSALTTHEEQPQPFHGRLEQDSVPRMTIEIRHSQVSSGGGLQKRLRTRLRT